MAKLDIKDFETLQEGLGALIEKNKSKSSKEKKKILKRAKEAENALMIIGTY